MTQPTLIFHITHISNLASALALGGLYSVNHAPSGLTPQHSAHTSIQARRALLPVTVGQGGVLHDYVPFYFGERSPMLYAIHRGQVAGVQHGQMEMIYLVGTVQGLQQSQRPWVFTDGHAVTAITRFFDNPSDLHLIDWAAVHARQWRASAEDLDLKRRKQAECLVHTFCPVSVLAGVAVINLAMVARVQAILNNAGSALPVRQRSDWYY